MRQTPWVTQGPLYPDTLPLNGDNDLIIISNSVTPAVGEITHLSGRLLGPQGIIRRMWLRAIRQRAEG